MVSLSFELVALKESEKNQKRDSSSMKKIRVKDKATKEGIEISSHNSAKSTLENQEALFKNHINSIKEDAMLLGKESELVSKAQGAGFSDFDLDEYVEKMDQIVKRKLEMYSQLDKKLKRLKYWSSLWRSIQVMEC